MLIDFSAVPEEIVVGARGGEGEFRRRVVDTGDNRILMGRLAPGASLGYHSHDDDSETVYILSGTGRSLCDGVYEPLKSGDSQHCGKGHSHNMENTGDEDLVFFAVIPRQ